MTVKTGMAMTEKGGMAMTAKRGTAGSGRRASVGRVSAGGRFGWPVGVCSAFTWPEAASGKRGSAGSRKNPLQRDAVRPAPRGWRAGASLAFASAGQPGRDADRRTRTRTPHNVRMGEQLRRRLGGGWPARGPATTAKRGMAGSGRRASAGGRFGWPAGGPRPSPGRRRQVGNADRLGRARTPYNVARCDPSAWGVEKGAPPPLRRQLAD